ncbi:MAG: hypothetical protein ACRC1K_00305, partial [Planctomycetia bacterium]
MRTIGFDSARYWFVAALFCATAEAARGEKSPIVPDDLLRLDGPALAVPAPNGARCAVVRRWVDPETQAERYSLWLSDAAGVRAMEAGEPDVRAAAWAPDGRRLAVRSTRSRPTPPRLPPTPPASDPATDLWIVDADTGAAAPLAGPDKPYGRVFADPFYGRAVFS